MSFKGEQKQEFFLNAMWYVTLISEDTAAQQCNVKVD